MPSQNKNPKKEGVKKNNKEQMKAWRNEHKEHVSNFNRTYYQEHKEEIKQRQKERYEKNKTDEKQKKNIKPKDPASLEKVKLRNEKSRAAYKIKREDMKTQRFLLESQTQMLPTVAFPVANSLPKNTFFAVLPPPTIPVLPPSNTFKSTSQNPYTLFQTNSGQQKQTVQPHLSEEHEPLFPELEHLGFNKW